MNRCGVLAGAGTIWQGRSRHFLFLAQFTSAQARPLKYIGFDGGGHQVRDCLHPRDLVPAFCWRR